MTIVHETIAVCSGCGYRMPATERGTHPSMWPMLADPDGQHYFCSHACLLEHVAETHVRTTLPHGFTTGDMRVLMLLGEGMTNKEIAVKLGTEVPAVKKHATAIYQSLGVQSRIEATLLAHATGLLNLHILAQRCAERLRAA